MTTQEIAKALVADILSCGVSSGSVVKPPHPYQTDEANHEDTETYFSTDSVLST